MSACRSCTAPIRWVTMTSGRPMPLNPEPNLDEGNIYVGFVAGEEVGMTLGGDELTQARVRGDELYVSHFATCPGADEHRRPR